MDQWTEATWFGRADPPTLRAVSGRSVRVLRQADSPPPIADAYPHPVETVEPDGIRVLIVGDDVLARRGVLAAIDEEPGLIVVGDRQPGPGVGPAIRSRNPDVLLLHGLVGVAAEPTLAAARQADATVRMLAIGTRAELSAVDIEAGLCGTLPASATPDEVVAAVRMAAAGYVLSRGSVHRAAPPGVSRDAALAKGLTERECEVLTLVAQGLSNAEIADALTLSEHTVKSHVQNLLAKLHLRNRIHAVIYAFDTGLARPVSRD